MIHPHTEVKFINKTVGYGLVATQLIPAGTITWALDDLDREFSPEQFESMAAVYQDILETYTYRNNKGNLVLCWDNGKFVNHSFDSNCLTTAYDFEIAVRDIQPGEQLTDDYGYLNISEPFEGIDEGTYRKIVYPDDLLNYHHIWDEQLKKVFHHILKVEQPLRTFISHALWDKVQRVSTNKEEMTSIVKNYFPQ
ncbi:SET domain-containing protein [Subsaximicrobium wynnwilliamsii]|uniref:SET domain-containing protein n=1 Tax=Subsaximicrobium wynnwilliamsii TaxID=291179 RepID=A0A5C6ZJB0_9FLAO|nr:SET domain-containing protein [Subsaximicrobium wynnwilliamsii]TXD84245.1 SET domain-containing protein [Subsaximicrobium wynnwilliamsii]TXD89866.1 SET domain-containing protein [Subsaximicrobium wynnwilliamsii]TXE03957.1 SET domain-containing protein [Subsaximicrobium wynnwilliamsii]